MTDLAAARRTMVENQLRTYDVTDQVLLAAFEVVPREAFADPSQPALVYLDRDVVARDGRSRLLAPMVLARMIQSLELNKGEKVLDVGGAGYGAAVMAAAGVQPVALAPAESADVVRASLAEAGFGAVPVVAGDLAAGAPAQGPFDAILVHGATDVEPAALLAQLKEDGALAIVLGRGRSGRATLYRRVGDAFSKARVFDAAAPLLAGFERKAEFAF